MPVALRDGTQVLFGFALEHPSTGGLAWTSSSPILELDHEGLQAVTVSGRHYRLGQITSALELPDEEARIAYALLVGDDLPLTSQELVTLRVPASLAVSWVTAMKIARHLKVEGPSFTQSSIQQFLQMYAQAYLEIRRKSNLV